jgi:hypothetical protein
LKNVCAQELASGGVGRGERDALGRCLWLKEREGEFDERAKSCEDQMAH